MGGVFSSSVVAFLWRFFVRGKSRVSLSRQLSEREMRYPIAQSKGVTRDVMYSFQSKLTDNRCRTISQ